MLYEVEEEESLFAFDDSAGFPPACLLSSVVYPQNVRFQSEAAFV